MPVLSLLTPLLRAQLSTLQASAAETPELEPRQKELQARVEGLEAQFSAAAAASAKVRAITYVRVAVAVAVAAAAADPV